MTLPATTCSAKEIIQMPAANHTMVFVKRPDQVGHDAPCTGSGRYIIRKARPSMRAEAASRESIRLQAGRENHAIDPEQGQG